MIDNVSYTMRIGMFDGIHKSYTATSVRPKSSLNFAFSLYFLVVVGLANSCAINDPGIEPNPGPPSQVNRGWSSDTERKSYFVVKNIYSDISIVSCHNYYLKFCKNMNIFPRSLDSINSSLATFKPNEKLKTAMDAINKLASLDKVEKIIEHYTELLTTLSNEKDRSLGHLASTCSPDRFTELTQRLLESHRTQTGEEMKNKQKKMNRMINKNADKKCDTDWLPELGLSITEKTSINNNDYICDSIINASMLLLNKLMPCMSFQSTTFQHDFLHYSPLETIHIHHNGHGHFVTTTSIGGKIKLFDSLNTSATAELQQQIAAIYSPDPTIMPQILGVESIVVSLQSRTLRS